MDTLPNQLRPVAEWIVNNWALCASLLGNVVLGVLYYLQWGEARKLRQIEEGREIRREKEEQGADLVARLRFHSRSEIHRFATGSHKLQITNTGQAQARNVHVRLNDTPINKMGSFTGVVDHPIPALAPGGSYEYRHTSDRDSPSHFKVTLRWDDEAGGGEWESTLNVT
jgi:hypothetical protein